MHPSSMRASALSALAQTPSPTAPPFTLAGALWHLDTAAATIAVDVGERYMSRRGRLAPLGKLARALARRPVRTARTCYHAARLLPTVRRAVPAYVWPILGAAAVIKCLPLDFGTDEALCLLAAVLILLTRPGLLDALYREAQAGKPARCGCPRHARRPATLAGAR